MREWFVIFIVFLVGCSPALDPIAIEPLDDDFMRGVNYAHLHRGENGYGSESSLEMKRYLVDKGVNWVAVTPFGYQEKVTDSQVKFARSGSSLRDQRLGEDINQAHKLGMRVMLKPHVWSNEFWENSKWRGDIKPQDKEKWFESYTAFIVHYAKFAGLYDVDLFVIGHEFAGLSQDTDSWREVIKEVRSEYSGKILYSADQNEFEEIEFWDDLDYIGINGYFPLVTRENPTVSEIRAGWFDHLKKIEKISLKYDKKVIFAEVGYRHHTDAVIRPWEWNSKADYSEITQANAYTALFSMLSSQDIIEGVFMWKYFTGPREDVFTPYGKEAEEVMKEWFQKT